MLDKRDGKPYPCLLGLCFLAILAIARQDKAVGVPFKRDIQAKDLVVSRVTATLQGDRILFSIQYESRRDRFISLFNPPQGDKLRYFNENGLRKNQTNAFFSVPKMDFMDIQAVVLKLSDPRDEKGDENFLYLNMFDKDVAAPLGLPIPATPARSLSSPGTKAITPVGTVTEFQDVRWKDLRNVEPPLSEALIPKLLFNLDTEFGAFVKESQSILERSKNPGLGVRSIHKRGITGKGVCVAMIDQNLCLDHPEFIGKIVAYQDVGTAQPAGKGSMHAPGVMSLLAGNTIGTAPDVRVYFAAAPSWTKDAKFQADALEWIIEINRNLPQDGKIRVVSISAAPSGQGSPFDKNNDLWDKAVERAEKEGLLVLDCTAHHGFIGPCYYDLEDPENVSRCRIGFPGMSTLGPPSEKRNRRVLAPCSYRTVAEEYSDGHPGYYYCGRGGLSWSIPYVAGVLALGWQVKPALSSGDMKELLLETAYRTKDGYRVINPVAFVDAVVNR
jgi:serine protease AprX